MATCGGVTHPRRRTGIAVLYRSAPYGGSVDGGSEEKQMRLRYAGVCRLCGVDLPARSEAIYERATKTVRCVSHGVSPSVVLDTPHVVEPADLEVLDPAAAEVLDVGTAGASARREFERRKARRDQRVRARHPKLGGLLLAISDEPQSTAAWDIGALGEERLGKGLDALASDRLRMLHDRRIPRSTANIDHLAVTSSGVYVIDAKKYRGRPRLKIEGGILRPRVERLLVGSRDCTKLVDGVLKQVDVVRAMLDDDVAVHGVLCFVEAEWPLIGGAFTTRSVQVLWPKKLYPQLQAEGQLAADVIAEIHRTLARSLRAA